MSDKDKKQKPEGEATGLSPAEKVESIETPASGDNSENACGIILEKIKNGCGIPVTVNFSNTRKDCSDSPFDELKDISKFIKDSRIDFNCFKKLADSILNEIYNSRNDEFFNGSENFAIKATGDIPCDPKVISKQAESFLDPKNKDNVVKAGYRSGPLIYNSWAYNILKFIAELYVHRVLGLSSQPPANSSKSLILPYLDLIETRFRDVCCKSDSNFQPLFVELIWNYWHEEGMMVHTINAISNRFQNKRSAAGHDPIVNLTLDALRPLNNLIWGYIQDSNNRLNSRRRSFEYDHQYGVSLFAAGTPRLNTADRRSLFIPAFHNLLYKCSLFYKEADDRMKVPDAFPVLNALREVHLVLAEGADNQFGDLPVTARIEMIIEQYILARPEVREFLGGRPMVPYTQDWMDRVDTMKSLQKWPGPSISYFNDLAEFGEEIILSLRWISWSQVNNRDNANTWALSFRDAVQRYIHCYHVVTGVDLSAPEIAGGNDEKGIMPAFLIQRKMQRDVSLRRR